MTVREHARRLLLEPTLEAKLAPFPRPLRDPAAPPVSVPDAPGRPPEIAFGVATRRARLPAADTLRDPARAAQLLHAFANHELLAIELMAVALLRYDMAPRARRELVATIEDEQRHLRGYVDRLADLGATFGQHPLSRFFWDALAHVPDGPAWHAGMGLTLEQANLDFMTWYAAAFRAADDGVTADLLEAVRRDEIAHVARGLRAFGADELWDRWRDALVEPLQPRRARGPTFDRDGRRQAGLPEDYIDRVAGATGSRGRPPDVWFFDVTGESDGGRGLDAKGPRGDVARTLATLPVALASEDDVVLLPRAPDPAWLAQLEAAGFPRPRLSVVDTRDEADLPRPLGRAVAWGPGAATDRLLGPHVDALGGLPEPHLLSGKCASAELLRALHGDLREAFGDELVRPDALPVVVREEAHLHDVVARMRATHPRVVIKADVSSSGRERIRLLHAHEPDDHQRAWIRRRIAKGPLRIEPWLEGVVDLSLHPAPRRWLVCRSDAAGRFRAAFPGRPTAAVAPDVARLLTGDGRDTGRLDRLASAIEAALAARGVPTPWGVDALVFRTPDGLRLHPLLEVNPRWTMGRVALRLARRVSGRSVCAWVHLSSVEAAALPELPLEVAPGARPKVRRGVVPTTAPGPLRTFLVVAASRAELAEALAQYSWSSDSREAGAESVASNTA